MLGKLDGLCLKSLWLIKTITVVSNDIQSLPELCQVAEADPVKG